MKISLLCHAMALLMWFNLDNNNRVLRYISGELVLENSTFLLSLSYQPMYNTTSRRVKRDMVREEKCRDNDVKYGIKCVPSDWRNKTDNEDDGISDTTSKLPPGRKTRVTASPAPMPRTQLTTASEAAHVTQVTASTAPLPRTPLTKATRTFHVTPVAASPAPLPQTPLTAATEAAHVTQVTASTAPLPLTPLTAATEAAHVTTVAASPEPVPLTPLTTATEASYVQVTTSSASPLKASSTTTADTADALVPLTLSASPAYVTVAPKVAVTTASLPPAPIYPTTYMSIYSIFVLVGFFILLCFIVFLLLICNVKWSNSQERRQSTEERLLNSNDGINGHGELCEVMLGDS